ncbi:MAG: GDCCVxC domain-containing (seleno)protein [Xanthobacteraceae bacterium]
MTCPHCGTARLERMPDDACQWSYTCTACGRGLKPKLADCCVLIWLRAHVRYSTAAVGVSLLGINTWCRKRDSNPRPPHYE